MIKSKGRVNEKKRLKQYSTHLIYAEGSETEPLYIENIKNILDKDSNFLSSNILIETIPESGGANTLSLIEYAEKDVKKRLKNNERISYVWIFYDKDSFPKSNFDNAKNKIEAKNKKEFVNSDNDYVDENEIRWEACWSNECFEIWVLLHFNYIESALSRKRGNKNDNLINMINENLEKSGCNFSYEKNNKNIYNLLNQYGDVSKAIKYAKRLEEKNGTQNPSTGVYKFLEYFDLYLKEAQNKH